MAENEQEYASIFFGFTPGSFADHIFNLSNGVVVDSLKNFRKDMLEKCDPAKVGEFEKVFEKFIASAEKHGMACSDKLKFVLQSFIFNVPDHIVLEQDSAQEEIEGASLEDIDAEIEETRKRIVAVKFALRMLDEAWTENEDLLKEMEKGEKEIQSQSDYIDFVAADVKKTLDLIIESI